jgi:hypothetical protein
MGRCFKLYNKNLKTRVHWIRIILSNEKVSTFEQRKGILLPLRRHNRDYGPYRYIVYLVTKFGDSRFTRFTELRDNRR